MGVLDKDIQKVLLTERDIGKVITKLGRQISEDYKDKDLLMVSVLKGSVITMADLMRAVTIPCCVDFMVVSSYGAGTESSGEVRILKDLDMPLENRELLLVEDILDSGKTLSYLRDILQRRNPRSVKICALLDKPERRATPIEADYCGIKIPNAFVVGYGLDYNEKYRNLPYVGILKESVYSTITEE